MHGYGYDLEYTNLIAIVDSLYIALSKIREREMNTKTNITKIENLDQFSFHVTRNFYTPPLSISTILDIYTYTLRYFVPIPASTQL